MRISFGDSAEHKMPNLKSWRAHISFGIKFLYSCKLGIWSTGWSHISKVRLRWRMSSIGERDASTYLQSVNPSLNSSSVGHFCVSIFRRTMSCPMVEISLPISYFATMFWNINFSTQNMKHSTNFKFLCGAHASVCVPPETFDFYAFPSKLGS